MNYWLKSCVIILISSMIPLSQGYTCTYAKKQRYEVKCDFWGWLKCTRYRYREGSKCCEGWTGDVDYGCRTALCFGYTWCRNGGRCTWPDHCSYCNRGYYSPRCSSCTQISNCLSRFCTTAYDQKCDTCDGDYGASHGYAYKKSDDQRQCIKQCSWRTDSNACYPGSCTNGACSCTTGFYGTDCRSMDTSQAPVLAEHRATLRKGTTTLESPTIQGSTDTVYTNLRDFVELQIVSKSSYQPTHLPPLTETNHPYIESVRLGVVTATITAVVDRVEDSTLSIATASNCLASGSRDNPATALVVCDRTFPISWTVTSGDILRCTVTSVSGGYMKLYDRDNSNRIVTRYYKGSTTPGYSTFIFDFIDPYHCVDSISRCRTTMLHAGDDATSQGTITVTWDGWVDDLAGIKEFDLQVRQLSGSHGDQMTEILDSPAVYSDTAESGLEITLPHTGVYSVVLTAVDNADNSRLSRRFIFFDDDPNDVTIQDTYPLRVQSATTETNYEWITTLDTTGGTTPVHLDWMNRFANLHHYNQGLLKPIGEWVSGSIDVDYDQFFGTRGRAAIPNALGITQFRVFHDIDHRDGRLVNASDDNSDHWSSEALNTQATYDLPLVDGDSIRFWVEARDIAGHFVRDSVLVHADSSPPIIENFWLVRDKDVNISVHNSVDLHDLSVEFRTYDIHSGVRTIEWRLFDNHTGSEVKHESQTVAAVKVDQDDCDPVTCMCVPIGDCYNVDYGFKPTFHVGVHDFDYYIRLTVTNHARHVTSQLLKITVDESPPQAGVVHDGIRGSGEVDFQGGNDLAAHWEGFFDKESGVKFYEYLYDVTCWGEADTIPSIKDNMTRTTVTHASWTAPSPGMYFITVIAYNRALEPSVPICSDGVMIDTSPPELSNISISDARMRPGLAKDNEGRVWFINEHRMKTELLNVSDVCRSKATVVSDITLYPGQEILNDSNSVIGEDINCRWTSGIQEKFFLPTHKHIFLSWSGTDAESSIYDYEIGLSSNPSNPTPDLVAFMSASGRDHFLMYHPHISQGNVFFLVVKAVNKAQLACSSFVGPIIVDTTRPMFVGHILVRLDGEYLVTEWGDDDFTDDEDAELAYQVGIGKTRGGTETVSFRSKNKYVIGPCDSQTFCAAFLLDDLSWYLHGDHEYYISVKAENGAGLSTVGTSSVYRHIAQLPSHGVVLDVSPTGEEVVTDFGDADVQIDPSRISAQWYGFEHPHLDINYEVAVGTGGNGSYDVSNGFIDVRNATSYQLHGLDLTPFMTYYFTVRATSETGSVIVTSDGIKVIPEGQILEGAFIKDGLGCNPDNITTPPGLSHHSTAPSQPCEDDVTHQLSTSGISARWTIPVMLQPFVTNVLWAVEQEIKTYNDAGNSSSEWVTLLDYRDLGMAFSHMDASLGLHDGAHLRSKAKFCHGSVCFKPAISDGFWVVSKPPLVGDVTITNIETDSTSTNLHVAFQTFEHAYIDRDRKLELMDFYEWTIAEDGEHSAVLSEWKRIDDLNIIGETANFTASFEGHLDHDTCLRMAVRGYNKVGLSSLVSTEVVDCDDKTVTKPHVVIDSDHEVTLEQNALWLEADKNYISSTTVLSAVWPSLRHRHYVWAAVKDTGSAGFGDLDNGLNYPCEHPLAEACGNTDKEFVNAHGLSLEHGERYRICIHADEVTLENEKWTKTLPSVSSCSDGVVVDTTPPTPGSVWIGWSNHNNYQSSTSELVLQWESFIDVEEHGLARHHSGIKYYEYAIGSMPGGSDVHDFTRVGIVNNIILHNLRLQNGHRYFAVIRATDFVGLSTTSSSDAIMIDTTPPTVSDVYTLDVGGSFLVSTTSVSPSWENVLTDQESGIAYYEWAVGSHPGHSDVIPFTREDSESGVSDPSQPLTLHEGHSYFISIKAINHVGLITLKAFGAFTVEESPPVAGHVFDGDPFLASSNHRDRDFQEERKTISAFWEGFHDPHSALIGYSWKAGTCKGCSDVIPEQHIGMETECRAGSLNLVPGLTYYVTVTACNAADLCTSVTSDGVLVDDSPPLVGRVYDGSPGDGDISFQSSRRQLSAHWWGFHDPHSSLSHYEWRAGTTPGSADILSSTRIELSQSVLMFLLESDQMLDNTDMYITVRAYNGLGMWSESTSNGFRVDSSRPQVIQEPTIDGTVGVVITNTQVLCDVIRFSWKFDDPESGIKEQYVSVSTHHNGDFNIPTFQIAASEVDHTFTNLTMHEGSHYVITVVACNHAGLCTEAKSTEFLVDGSSPTVGTFAVETESAAKLERHHIIWITPTEPGLVSTTSPGNIYNKTSTESINSTSESSNAAFESSNCNTESANSSTDSLNSTTESSNCTIGSSYCTIESSNCTIESSNCTVESSNCSIESSNCTTVSLNSTIESSNCTIESSNCCVEISSCTIESSNCTTDSLHSTFESSNCTIESSNCSIKSLNCTIESPDRTIESLKCTMKSSHYTTESSNCTIDSSNCSIDSSNYTIESSNCTESSNSAIESLKCTIESSNCTIKSLKCTVESSKCITDSASATTEPMTTPRPPRYHSGWMTWLQDPLTSTGSLALAWIGFADLHSGISHYFIAVGRTYGGSELTPSGPVRVNHSSDGMSLDEGITQTAIIPVEGSITGSYNLYLFVSLWAVNGVGLPSSRHHSTFEISETSPDEGALVLLRRCQSATCEGHCTCAPIHVACSTEQGQCSDLTRDNPNTEIEVLDLVDLNFDVINNLTDINVTLTQYMMAAAWRVSQHKGLNISWYEWSIGDDSSSDVEPTGVFDSANERVWFDIGQENHTIVTLDKDRMLTTGLRYHFYIRAWYSDTTYAVFRSDGVTPDIKAPEFSTLRGTKIKDLATDESTEDTDYLNDTDTMYVSWEGVFRDDEISHYEVSLGTFKGGEDVRHFVDTILTASESRTRFTGLGLQSGHRYYSNVRAINKAGLRTLRSSDGFVVDLRKPDAGLVFDGIDLHDVEYQNSSTLISASWHGFTDLESYIDHYEWCVGRTPDSTDDSVLQCIDVGMQLSASRTLLVPLTGGVRYYSRVSAIDAAGRASKQVFSDGVVVDVTPPEPHNCIHSGDNLIVNPSFEGQNESDTQEPMSTQLTDNSSPALTIESRVTDSTTEAELNDNSSPVLTTESHVTNAATQHEAELNDNSSPALTTESHVTDATTQYGAELNDNSSPALTAESHVTDATTQYEAELNDNSSPALTTESHVTDATTQYEAELTDKSSPASLTESPVIGFATNSEEDSNPQDEITPWKVGSGTQITVVTHGKKVARDGRSFLSLHGSISQTFNSTPGSHYRVLFFTSHVVPSHEPMLNQEGRIEAPGLNRVFRLYSRPAGSHSNQNLASIQWHEQRFYFTATEALSTLRISSVGRSNGILLDNIQVTLLTTEPSTGQGSVDVHTQFIHNWSSLEAKWHFIDPESPIIDYNWAIGTSSGGTQLQNFKSVGTQTDAMNTELRMYHGSNIYVTVTATNAADLTSFMTSDPILIDLTAPIILSVLEGPSEDDIDFSSNDKCISLRWSVSDPESGIDYCEWAIGLEPGFDDVIPSTLSPDLESKVIADLSGVMVEGHKLFSTVKCFNNAGRSSWKSSDGVTIVTEPPSSLAAVVKVKAVSDTAYATLDGYQSQNSSLKASWEGFTDPFGIQFYQCRLTGPSYSTSPWTRCGSASEEHLNWSDLTLQDDATYSLSVRAVNHADLISQAITKNFTVETSRPTSQDSKLLTSAWYGNGTVDFSWDELFVSSSPMFFEASLGTILGGSDVMQWIETMHTGMRVSPLVPHTDYYITVTAINAAGLAQTVKKVVYYEK